MASGWRGLWSRLRPRLSVPAIRDFGYHSFIFASWVPMVILFNDHVMRLSHIEGPSMYPFLNPDMDTTTRRDWVVNWKWGAQHNLARGMIITFWSPFDPETMAVKRIIGLEGDVVQTRRPYPYPSVKVPPGHVWVEGDGGERKSLDSNDYGPIALSLIVGKVTHIVLPLHRAGTVRWWEFTPPVRRHN